MCVAAEFQLLTPVIVRRFGTEDKHKDFLVPQQVIEALTRVPMHLFESERRIMIFTHFTGLTSGGWASFDEATMSLQGLKEEALRKREPYTADTIFITIDIDHSRVRFFEPDLKG